MCQVKLHPWFAGLDWASLARHKAAFVPTLEHEYDTSYFASKPVRSSPSGTSASYQLFLKLAVQVAASAGSALLTVCTHLQVSRRSMHRDVDSRSDADSGRHSRGSSPSRSASE
jgi:hypothetical protein